MVRLIDVFYMTCNTVLPAVSILIPVVASSAQSARIPPSHRVLLAVGALLCLVTWMMAAQADYRDKALVNLAFACSVPQFGYLGRVYIDYKREKIRSELARAEVVSDREGL